MAGDDASMLPLILGAATLALYAALAGPAIDRRRWPLAVDVSRQGLVFGLLGLAVLAYFFQNNLMAIPIILVAVIVHEYGHVLAFRLAGHPRPVFRLAPFGGVAFSDKPPRSEAENAFIALMGPGFSLALVVAALLTAWFARDSEPVVAQIAVFAAAMVGALNFFNLLPFYPLDGGRTVKAVASLGGPSVANGAALVMCGALALISLLMASLILLLFALIGLAAAQAERKARRPLPPIPPGHAVLAVATYLATLAAHGFAALPLLVAFLPAAQAPT